MLAALLAFSAVVSAAPMSKEPPAKPAAPAAPAVSDGLLREFQQGVQGPYAREACNDRQQHIIQKGNAFFCEECPQADLYNCILKNASNDMYKKVKARMDGFEVSWRTELSGWAYGRQYVSPEELPKSLVNKCLAIVCPIAAQQKGYY
jgi:hypothetical protein